MPPEIVASLALLALAILGGGTLIVRAASKYIADKFEVEGEKRKIELDNLRREAAENAANSKFVLNALDQQGKLIAGLQADKDSAIRQLEEMRSGAKAQEGQLGELRALLSKTASERDQERLQRETAENQRNAAIKKAEAMEQKIIDLENKALEVEELKGRVAYLEERDRANNEALSKIKEIEIENAKLKEELIAERRKTQQIPTPTEVTNE